MSFDLSQKLVRYVRLRFSIGEGGRGEGEHFRGDFHLQNPHPRPFSPRKKNAPGEGSCVLLNILSPRILISIKLNICLAYQI